MHKPSDDYVKTLWKRVQDFQIDDPKSSFKFSDRLALENGWSLKYAKRVIEEYKKFMFLAVVSGHSVTPSDGVDQVWHLHLLYTQSYWKEFCQGILEKEINHGPTKGGKKEGEKFNDWYQKTKESYKIFFGEEPPADIWPSSKERFRVREFQRVDVEEYYMIPKDLWIGKLLNWLKN